MKRRMTAKKSLRIIAEHFRWLEKNPKAAPNSWPGWADYGIDTSIHSKDKNPLCEVADGNCMRCPLIALWIKDSGDLPDNQKLKSCLVRTSPWSIMQGLRNSRRPEDRERAEEATRSVYLEAEYALEHGVREPDLSIYAVRRTSRKRRKRTALSDRGLEDEKRERLGIVRKRRQRGVEEEPPPRRRRRGA